MSITVSANVDAKQIGSSATACWSKKPLVYTAKVSSVIPPFHKARYKTIQMIHHHQVYLYLPI